MTRQVTEGSPITVTARSQVGGFIPDAALNIDGDVYANPACDESFDEHRCNGAGEFTFYAAPGTVITVEVDDPIAVGLEPIQVVGVAGRPGGLAAVHPGDTPAVHEQSAISEHVTDSSLVGAVGADDALPEDEGGALAAVGVSRAQNVPPVVPEGGGRELTPNDLMAQQTAPETPDGTAATDPDSVNPPSVQEEQATPMYEAVATPGGSELRPESVTETDALVGNNAGGTSTALDVHGDSDAVAPPVDENADGTETVNTATGETTAGTSEPA